MSLHESKESTVYIGSNGGGLLSYHPNTDTFKGYTDLKGFEEPVINDIIIDNTNNIWVSGSLGLTQLDLKSKKAINYDIEDGLLSNYFHNGTLLKGHNGHIYAGNFIGVNHFSPSELKINTIAPKPYLSKLKLFNKEVKSTTTESPLQQEISQSEGITLNHKQSVFTIDYASINYTRPENTQYAYMLKGFDKNWNLVGKNISATYTNLASGNYLFKLKTANNDGIWNENPVEFKIKVLPPWWESIWAILVYLLAFILSIRLFIKYRVSEVKRKEKNKYQRKLQNQIKLEEGRQIEKDRVAKELHDGVLGSIFGIRMGLDALSLQEGKNQDLSRKKYIQKLSILENEIRELSHGLSPDVGASELAYAKTIETYIQEQCAIHNLKYTIVNDPNISWENINDDVRFNLYRIIQETLQNVFLHANANEVKIHFSCNVNSLTLVVCDNGIGFQHHKPTNGIGLKNITSRIKSLSGQVKFENNEKKGANVVVTIPIKSY